jgi:hypothetical protein
LTPSPHPATLIQDPTEFPDLARQNFRTPHQRVTSALRTVAPSARLVGTRRVGEAWVTTVLVDHHREDLAFDGGGGWLGRARQVSIDAAPYAVQETVDKHYRRFSVWRVDVHQYPIGEVYVIQASRGSVRVEGCVASDGTLLGERQLEDGEV